jgi:hypothetical protein
MNDRPLKTETLLGLDTTIAPWSPDSHNKAWRKMGMWHAAYRSIVRRLPVFLKAPLKRAVLWIVGKPLVPLVPEAVAPAAPVAALPPDGTNLLDFVHPETMTEIMGHIGNPAVILQMQFARQVIARDRASALLARTQCVDGPTPTVIHNAVGYNLAAAHTAPMLDRPMICTNVISSIERVGRNRATMDVLSIGPRSEIEIFGLWSAGFARDRVKGLDLFSYSPFIDVGDMHAMPHADNSFDIIVLSQVLPYSRDQQVAANEVFRVCRDRAIVAVATDYTDEMNDRSTFNHEGTHNQSVDQILGLFAGRVRSVYFRHEASPPDVMLVMTVFEIEKPGG